MKIYADFKSYKDKYLLGRDPKIPEKEFGYWAMLVSAEIRKLTFGRIDELEEIPEEVQLCCCEVAERLYSLEAAKGENGLILQSYGNDGDTGTFKTDDLSESSVRRTIPGIIRKWLISTGMMYCGVEE